MACHTTRASERLAVLHARWQRHARLGRRGGRGHARWRRHVRLGRRGGRGHGSSGGFLGVLGAAELAGAAPAGRGAPALHTALAEVVLAEGVAHQRRLAAPPPAPVLPAAP